MAVLSLIKCHSQQKCRFCRQEKAESCHPVCVFDEAAKINLQFLQLKARGKEQRACEMEVKSSHLQPTLSPCVWNEPFYFEKENQINICVRIGKEAFRSPAVTLFCEQTTVTVCSIWITFSVYCNISQQTPDLKHQITGSFAESQGLNLIWQRFYWQSYKSQRSCL